MKRNIFILSGFLLFLSNALMAQTLFYQEKFDRATKEWSDRDDMYSHEKMENGKFYITQKKDKYSYHAAEVALEDDRDYSVETVVTHISGTELGPYGLVFAGEGPDNNYIFAISAGGSYSFGYTNDGHYRSFIKTTESQAIKRGNNAANKLRIETAGDKIKLFINDRQVNTVNMVQPYGNDIGFSVEKEQTVAFDYLTVKYLTDPDKETAAEPVKAIASLPAKDTVKNIVNLSPKASVSLPVKDTVKNIVNLPPRASVSLPVKDTGKNLVNKPLDAVIVQPAKIIPPAKDSARRVITPPVNITASQTAKDTIKHAATVPARDTVKQPAVQLAAVPANQPARDSATRQAINIVKQPIKDTIKQQVNPLVNNPVTSPIIEMAYHTDFSTDDQTGWVLNNTDSVNSVIGKGELTISRKSKGWLTDAVRPSTHVDMERGFLIETRATHYSGGKYYDYGIEFGADSIQAYHFWISSSGYYSIAYTNNNGYIKRIKSRMTDSIIKGDSVKNKLAIEHKNQRLYFFINDKLVDNIPEIDFQGQQFGFSVNSSQNIGFDHLTFGYIDQPPLIIKTDTIPGPQITITSPKVTRGLKIVPGDTLHVVGTAKDPAGIFSVTVNGETASVGMTGEFLADVPLIVGDNTLKVVALSMDKRQSTAIFHIVRSGNVPASEPVIEQPVAQPLVTDGKYYALLIGAENYRDPRLQTLDGPISDANKLKVALLNNYTFNPENVKVLPNPSREDLFNALIDIRNKVTGEDNVVIFFAGHGYYDDATQQGYWLPVDADRYKSFTWISNSDIVTNITAIKSKHTLLISDACFSGSILRMRGLDNAPKAIRELYNLPSRNVMASSTIKEEASDNSQFLKYLVKYLSENTDQYLSSQQLFERFKAAVINNSDDTTQVPQFGELRGAGDEGGDFIFIKKGQN